MLVKIKPIEVEKWHGKSGKESFGQPLKLKALYNKKTGRYSTGLKEEDRIRLEKLTNFDLSDNFNPQQPHPFWDTEAATVTLPNHTIILNTSIPLDEIKYFITKASDFVANTESEYAEGKYPSATHVIFDEEEEVKIKATKAAIRTEAYKKALKMSVEQKRQIILILNGKNVRNQSNDFIEVEMDDILTKQPEMFLEYVDRDKAYLSTKAMVLEGIYKSVLSKRGDSIYYMDELLGATIDDAVNYLNDPKNQSFKLIILEKLG